MENHMQTFQNTPMFIRNQDSQAILPRIQSDLNR